MAGALAQAGRHDQAATVATQAEQIARSITNPDRQAQALTGVADALAQAGDVRWACRVVAAAFAAGRWTTAVKPVLKLDHAAAELLRGLLE